MLGDFNSKLAVQAVGAIRKEYPEASKTIDFEIVTSRTLDTQAHLSTSARQGVGLVHIMDRRQVERLKPTITALQRQGFKVYAIGGSYGKEDRELGLIDDPEVGRYYRENGRENITRMLLFLLSRDCGLDVAVREFDRRKK